jgi:hypothetical protein
VKCSFTGFHSFALSTLFEQTVFARRFFLHTNIVANASTFSVSLFSWGCIPNGRKIFLTAVKIYIYQHFPFQGTPRYIWIGTFGMKICYLSTLYQWVCSMNLFYSFRSKNENSKSWQSLISSNLEQKHLRKRFIRTKNRVLWVAFKENEINWLHVVQSRNKSQSEKGLNNGWLIDNTEWD